MKNQKQVINKNKLSPTLNKQKIILIRKNNSKMSMRQESKNDSILINEKKPDIRTQRN